MFLHAPLRPSSGPWYSAGLSSRSHHEFDHWCWWGRDDL